MQNILHTGDMRWKPSLADAPALQGLRIDLLFLDTTYASPKHTHPPQVPCLPTCHIACSVHHSIERPGWTMPAPLLCTCTLLR